jgi:hypothetical protein
MLSQTRLGLVILFVLTCCTNLPVTAQGRLSDKDLLRLMQSVKDDAQRFRQTFGDALKKSTIGKTSREKDARALADAFAKQTSSAVEAFKRDRKAEPQVTALIDTAAQIDPLVNSLHLTGQTSSQWEKLRLELHQISQEFGVPAPHFAPQAGDKAQVLSSTGTCLDTVGVERSRQLVNECLQVSPSTHPPCNAQNSCLLIVDEIKRGCDSMGQGMPRFCADYR